MDNKCTINNFDYNIYKKSKTNLWHRKSLLILIHFCMIKNVLDDHFHINTIISKY